MAGLWLAQIEKLGPEHVTAIITDGAAVNPAAAKIVRERCVQELIPVDAFLALLPSLTGLNVWCLMAGTLTSCGCTAPPMLWI